MSGHPENTKRLKKTNERSPSVSSRPKHLATRSVITPELAEFVAAQDMFYLGTASADGQPYIQYRGGPRGFLRVIDSTTLGFADFAGNRQYLTVGNLSENPKAFIFLIDYVNRRRIKLWGSARVVENDTDLLRQLTDDTYAGRVERAILFQIETWDINCPKHIHRRVPIEAVEPYISQLEERIRELEKQLGQRG